MAGKLVEHPFDTIKVRLQTQSLLRTGPASSSAPGAKVFSGPWECLRKTVSKEGWLGLYQGLPSPLLGATLENATLFFVYHQIQVWLRQWHSLDPSQTLPFHQLCLAGGLSGSCASLILTPVEFIKCQVQVYNIRQGLFAKNSTCGNSMNPNANRNGSTARFHSTINNSGTTHGEHTAASTVHRRRGTLAILRYLLKEAGWHTLFRGFTWTFIRETGGGMAWFGAYESMCRFLLHRRSLHPDRKDQLSALELMVAGGTAGMAYHITFFPADVIKSVYQTQPAVPTSSSSSVADGSGTGQQLKWRDVVRSVVRRDGIRGFYQGLGITLLRAFPSNAVVFLCYENLSRYWKTVHG